MTIVETTAVPVTASTSEILRRFPALCRNCDAVLSGRFCAGCGQAVEQSDRVGTILREWAASIVHPEHVVWSTIVDLALRPARLTLDWWSGKRVVRMSPVRTLVSLLVVGAVLAGVREMTLPALPGDIALGFQVFAYQNAILTMLILPLVLSRWAPSASRLTAYHHVSFALYETASMTLLYGALMTSLFMVRLASEWVGSWILPSIFGLGLGAVIAVFSHFFVHLREAYGFRGVGGLMTAGAIVAGTLLTSFVLSCVMSASGFDDRWEGPGPYPEDRLGWNVRTIDG